MDDIELSIIMISYNEENYLRFAIDSVVNQKFTKWELLIGDDGSSDNSLEIIKEYSLKYPDKIKYYVMDRNDGVKIPSIRVSNNIKRGFSLARGKYFSILAGDDFFNEKFQKEIDILNKKKKYSAVVSDFKYAFEDSSKDFNVRNCNSRRLFWSACYAHISCFTFRKECLGNLLDNFCDDTGMIYSIACTGKRKYTHSVDFSYRQRSESIMTTSNSVQLNMLELLLFDDILKKRKFKFSSLSRFNKPIRYIFKNRKKIIESKEKYNNYLEQDDGRIIDYLINYDKYKFFKKLKCRLFIMSSIFFKYTFSIFRRSQSLFCRRKNGN